MTTYPSLPWAVTSQLFAQAKHFSAQKLKQFATSFFLQETVCLLAASEGRGASLAFPHEKRIGSRSCPFLPIWHLSRRKRICPEEWWWIIWTAVFLEWAVLNFCMLAQQAIALGSNLLEMLLYGFYCQLEEEAISLLCQLNFVMALKDFAIIVLPFLGEKSV